MIAFHFRSHDAAATLHRRGLTLFEVLLSLAILAGSLAAIGQLGCNGARYSVEAGVKAAEAVIRCQSKLAELIAIDDPTAGVTDEPFADDPAWSWTLSASETEVPGLYLLLLTVNHDGGDGFGNATYSLSRMYRDPLAISVPTATTDDTTTGGGL